MMRSTAAIRDTALIHSCPDGRATMGPQRGNGPPLDFAPSTSRAVEPVIVAVSLKIQPFSVRASIHLFSIGMRRIAATGGFGITSERRRLTRQCWWPRRG